MSSAQRTLDDFRPEGSALPETGLPTISPEGFIQHPLLRKEVLRAYPFQLDLASQADSEDLLVVLPTGLGKTVIAALLAARRFAAGTTKSLLLAPTKPLVHQHARSFSAWFESLPHAVFTGEVDRPVREEQWATARMVFATPQLVVQDLLEGRYSLREVGLVIYDEAHHARGRYAYSKIAAIYQTQGPPRARQLALTASPGNPTEIRDSLHLSGVVTRTREDPEVAPYIQTVDTSLRRVSLSEEQKDATRHLREAARETMLKLQRIGLLRTRKLTQVGVKDLVDARKQLFALPLPMGARFQALRRLAIAQHLLHSVGLIERQGLAPFVSYLDTVAVRTPLKPADRAFLALPAVGAARALAQGPEGGSPSHPKLEELLSLVRATLAAKPAAKILVFTEYRDSVRSVADALRKAGVPAERFVGQAHRGTRDPGMNQHTQLAVLGAFRSGAFPVLVASQVAEEGLDIPQVDLVVEYDILSSGVRTAQRRGRTGRTQAGQVVSLLSEGTKEERYRVKELARSARLRRVLRKASTR